MSISKYIPDHFAQYVGLSICLVYGAALYIWYFQLFDNIFKTSVSILALSFPIIFSSLVQLITDPRKQNTLGEVWKKTMALCFILSFLLFLINAETLLCIVIALPMYALLCLLVLYITRLFLKTPKEPTVGTRLYASWFIVPLLLPFVLEIPSVPTQHETVVSEMTINAPIEVVWHQTLEIPEIQSEERIWTFSHNILFTPRPIEAKMDGNIRKLQWTNNIYFEEHVTSRIENKSLKWDFVFTEKSNLREIDPHIHPKSEELHLLGGGYELFKVSESKTRIRLESNYRLKTLMNGYLSLWGDLFLSDFHDSVLHVIKLRAENTLNFTSKNNNEETHNGRNSL